MFLLENDAKEISFKNFQKLDMRVKDKKAYYNGKVLKTDSEIVKAEKAPDGARVR